MTVTSFLIFLPAILIGSLLIHLIWPERSALALFLKFSLGIGAGLGISSILFFLSLLIAPGRVNMMAVQLALLVVFIAIVILRERGQAWYRFKSPTLSRLQWGLIGAVLLALVFAILASVNIYNSRPQGAFDAWSIWNRAARFIYRDPQNWRATTSPDLYWGTHADYPLLVPLNVAWGWETLGTETQRVPFAQGLLFTLASFGVMFASVGLTRTSGQASLATFVLICTPFFFETGIGQISDIPVTYFIFAACALIYLYFQLDYAPILMIAGFMAGLSGWSKNEGLLMVAVSVAVLAVTSRKKMFKPFLWYLVGLAIPMAVIVYFKIAFAPPSDLFAGSSHDTLTKIVDFSRYWIILKSLGQETLTFGGWPFSILIGLAVYAVVMYTNIPSDSRMRFFVLAAIILLQLLGYCAIYVITPHDLEWHIGTSLSRLVLQLYPAGIFLLFSSILEPEKIFAQKA